MAEGFRPCWFCGEHPMIRPVTSRSGMVILSHFCRPRCQGEVWGAAMEDVAERWGREQLGMGMGDIPAEKGNICSG